MTPASTVPVSRPEKPMQRSTPADTLEGKHGRENRTVCGRYRPEAYFEGKNGLLNDSRHADIRALNDDFKKEPKRTLPHDSLKTIVVKMEISGCKVKRFSFLPVWIDDATYVPEILTHEDPRFGEVVDYMTQITESQKIEPRFAVEGDEVRVLLTDD